MIMMWRSATIPCRPSIRDSQMSVREYSAMCLFLSWVHPYVQKTSPAYKKMISSSINLIKPMNDTIIAIIGGFVTTVLSGFTSWFFAKKKYNAEVDNHLITNMQESLEFYKTLADDNKVRLEAVLAENAELRKEVNEMREKLVALTSVLAQYGLLKLMEDNKPEE